MNYKKYNKMKNKNALNKLKNIVKNIIKESFNDDKIMKYEKYTYTLNGKIVNPEIGFYDNILKAVISTPRPNSEFFNYSFYNIGIPDEKGVIELKPSIKFS